MQLPWIKKWFILVSAGHMWVGSTALYTMALLPTIERHPIEHHQHQHHIRSSTPYMARHGREGGTVVMKRWYGRHQMVVWSSSKGGTVIIKRRSGIYSHSPDRQHNAGLPLFERSPHVRTGTLVCTGWWWMVVNRSHACSPAVQCPPCAWNYGAAGVHSSGWRHHRSAVL